MSLHISKVRLNLSEIPFTSECVNLSPPPPPFLLFLPNLIDSKNESVYYWGGLERWTLDFLCLDFNAMRTPHCLINSDLLGENWELHFAHKGWDVDLCCRDYWFKFLVYEKNGSSAICFEKFRELVSYCWLCATSVEWDVLRLGGMLKEKDNRYSGTTTEKTLNATNKHKETNFVRQTFSGPGLRLSQVNRTWKSTGHNVWNCQMWQIMVWEAKKSCRCVWGLDCTAG